MKYRSKIDPFEKSSWEELGLSRVSLTRQQRSALMQSAHHCRESAQGVALHRSLADEADVILRGVLAEEREAMRA